MPCGHLHETPWAAWGCQLLGITPPSRIPKANKRRRWQTRADEVDSRRRAVEPLKQNTHRSSTRASTSSSCLARWPHPSAEMFACWLHRPPHPASQLRSRPAGCMQAAVREALPLSTRPVHVFGRSFHPRCPNRSAIGLPWPLATPRAERTELAGCRSSWAGAPAYGGPVLCLCATLTIATGVSGTQRFRHVSHVSKPSLSRGSIARETKEKIDPGASTVGQARYSSELRTDGAGSVTPSESHRSRHRRSRAFSARQSTS